MLIQCPFYKLEGQASWNEALSCCYILSNVDTKPLKASTFPQAQLQVLYGVSFFFFFSMLAHSI